MKKIVLIVAALALPLAVLAQSWQFDFSHQIKQADSVNSNKLYYKDTLRGPNIDISLFNRVWFFLHKLTAATGTDSNFVADSVEVFVQTSDDGTHWNTVTVRSQPRAPLFATADSSINFTVSLKRDSAATHAGPLARFMVVLTDTSAWSHGILGNTYGRSLIINAQGVKP